MGKEEDLEVSGLSDCVRDIEIQHTEERPD